MTMKKICFFIPAYFALSLFAKGQTSDVVRNYIDKYKELAIQEEIRTGVPASITLAQGLLESGAGQSDLSQASNNHFGIKCKTEWTGAKVYHDDDARSECFRSYPSVEDSYRDHSDFLKNRPNYSALFYLDPADYKSWALGLKKAGYATEKAYAQNLIKTIEDNGLQQYTLLAMQRGKMPQQDITQNNNSIAATAAVQKENTATAEPPVVQNTSVQQTNEAGISEVVSYPAGTFSINNVKVVFAPAGTSLFALATKSNLSFKKLLDFNNLSDNEDILKQDKLIYLERKPKKSSSNDVHIVAASETLEDISQKEGVDLESLYEYNKIQKGMQPATGEKVYLKPGNPSYYPRLVKTSSTNTR